METIDRAIRSYMPQLLELAPETRDLAARMRALPNIKEDKAAVTRSVDNVLAEMLSRQDDQLDGGDLASIDWAGGCASAHVGHNREDWIHQAARATNDHDLIDISHNLVRIGFIARRFARQHGRTAEANTLAGWPADI
ncbi:hypothetical protein ACGFJT_37485 [Actinomadura geliboluensis]|uniref:hypothetical protein n=1 Tax=Actinomadura geliboluensis TaxID=882440 RepID=UPI00371A50B4